MVANTLSQEIESMDSMEYLNISRCMLAREVQTLVNNFIRLQVTRGKDF